MKLIMTIKLNIKKGMYILLVVFCAVACLAFVDNQPTRNIILTYTCYITNLPGSTRQVDCWIPVPSSNERQTVEILSADRANGRITIEHKYGNQMYYQRLHLKQVKPADTFTIRLSYKINIKEKTVQEAKDLATSTKTNAGSDMQIYLGGNRLIPLTGAITNLNQQLQLPASPIPAARKIYDYLIDTMIYNYKAPGAGHGDAVWACSSHTGDCSDYHSIFIGVCRASGIPADHVFGLPLRAKDGKGEVRDWHCWARFWVDGPGWITIDASEAAKHPELHEYNFGTLSNVYLTLSHGRDVSLVPVQQGPPLNIFADPYIEADGKSFGGVKWVASFQEENHP
jgi:transglutaminase-like putative cysteine protease